MRRTGAGILLGAALLLLPPLAGSTLQHLLVVICLYAYLGQAWNLLGGYAGQFSFGHAAFFGVGAYTSTLLYMKLGVSPWIGLGAAGLAGLAVGLVCGYLSFRYGLKGPYFALVMLAFAEMLRLLAENWAFTGAAQGILIPFQGAGWADFQFQGKLPFYYIALTMLALVTLLAWRLERSRAGYYLKALREDEEAADALGVNPFRYKLLAMALSAGCTGAGGAFYAQYLLYIDPEITFGAAVSVEILLRPIIGGAGTVLGPILGSLLLTPLSELSKVALRGHAGLHLMIYGAVLVLVILFLPRGIAGLGPALRRRLQPGSEP
jgi:branched-chain amino acid transport system permease protein